MRDYAVPIFMFMSFLLSHRLFSGSGEAKVGKRVWRLTWPLWGWGIIYFIVYSALGINKIGLSTLFWQMTTGHSALLNPAMWYQSVLICLTMLFFVIYRYIDKQIAKAVSVLLLVLSLFMQYSGYNYRLFGDLPYELKCPLGRLVEMVPYASLGVLAMEYPDWIQKRNHRAIILIMCPVALIFSLLLKRLLPETMGFQYSGIPMIGITVSVVLFLYALPIDRLSIGIKNIIYTLAKSTLGIYCMHNMVGTFLVALRRELNVAINDVCLCAAIFLVSYAISWCITKVPNRYVKMLVC